MSFVINRSYILKINGEVLPHTFVTQSAVPQGSPCGPVLFILMAADIANITINTNVRQLGYADDTEFICNVNTLHDQLKLQEYNDELHA